MRRWTLSGAVPWRARLRACGWTGFLRGLTARDPSGVRLVISDARPGLVEAARSVMAGAAWRRCRTHYLRNLLTKVPESAQPLVATLVRSIFAQPDAAQVHLVPQGAPAPDLVDQPPGAAQQGDPPAHPTSWAPFPTRASVLRLVDAVLAETHDEWADTRRYMTVDALLRLEKAA